MPATAVMDATAVFTALTKRTPMDWQRQWLSTLTSSEPTAWPSDCSVPTGLGKTMIVPMLVVAMGFVQGAPRRVIYTVNRQRLVDQTYAEMLRLQKRLTYRTDPEVVNSEQDREVLDAFVELYTRNMGLVVDELAHPTAKEAIEKDLARLLDIYILRGDLEEPLGRLKSPLMPTVILSTLDQAGSRILFRGYGESRRVTPMSAGLLAYDCAWVNDEAHGSPQLLQTLACIHAAISGESVQKPARPFLTINLSATPKSRGVPFVPSGDIEVRKARAAKTLTIEIDEADDLPRRAIRWYDEITHRSDTSLKLSVMCNTVTSARKAFDVLKHHAKNADVILVIGQIRTKEREDVFASAAVQSLFNEAERPERNVVAVCTQTIEVGIDFDFDHMLTQMTAIDSLTQRLGRLNRSGDRTDATAIMYGSLSKSPIYGTAPMKTAEYLSALTAPIHVSPQHMSALLRQIPAVEYEAMAAGYPPAEPLVGLRLRRLGWTALRGLETTPEWYIHGERSGEVSVIWRSAISAALLTKIASRNTGGALLDRLAVQWLLASPIRALEVASLSLHAARSILLRNLRTNANDVNDAQDSAGDGGKEADDKRKPRYALRWDGEEIAVIIARQLRPGDTIVIPSEYGWHDDFGLAPKSDKPVADLSDEVKEDYELPAVVQVPGFTMPSQNDFDSEEDRNDAAITRALEIARETRPMTAARIAAAPDGRVRLVEFPVGRWLLAEDIVPGCSRDAATTASRQIKLTDHNASVGALAAAYATRLRLADAFIAALEQAGRLHDLGKAHPLFQRIRLGNRGTEVCAKSVRRGDSSWEYRHEAISVLMAASGEKTTPLSRHLIGTHHGDGRPHFRPENEAFVGTEVRFDQDGRTYTSSDLHGANAVDSTWRSDFLDLEDGHSTWGLAYLEAVLRFADWNVSGIESAVKPKPLGAAS